MARRPPLSETTLLPGGRKKLYHVNGAPFVVDVKYDVIKSVGSSATVAAVKATDTSSGSAVEIRKHPRIFNDGCDDAARLLHGLRVKKHLGPHEAIESVEVLSPREDSFEELAAFPDVYTVSPSMDTTLHRVIHSTHPLTWQHHAYFTYQLLEAVAFMHSAGVVYQHLHPDCLLINADCTLKVGGFDGARACATSLEPNESSVVEPGTTSGGSDCSSVGAVAGWPASRQYASQYDDIPTTARMPPERSFMYTAPEVLLGLPYDQGVDVWAAGCILAELVMRRQLFRAQDTMHLIRAIIAVVGLPPTEEELRAMAASKPEALRFLTSCASPIRTNQAAGGNTKTRLLHLLMEHDKENDPQHTAMIVDLLSRMLQFDPRRRITAAEAMRHELFDIMHDTDTAIPKPPRAPGSIGCVRGLDEAALRRELWTEMTSAGSHNTT